MKWFMKRAFAPGMDTAAAGMYPSAVHLLKCCGSVLRSLLRGEVRSDVLFGKLLAAIAALRNLYEIARRRRAPRGER
jgi:hypothetical protein